MEECVFLSVGGMNEVSQTKCCFRNYPVDTDPAPVVPGSYMRLLTVLLYKTVYFLTVSFTGCFMCIANNDVMKRSSSSS